MLFVDFTSALNIIIHQTVVNKPHIYTYSSLCNWVMGFLSNRLKSIRIHNISSSSITLSIDSPKGCVLSPFLFIFPTYDCSAKHPGCHTVKFAADPAMVRCIINSDESGYSRTWKFGAEKTTSGSFVDRSSPHFTDVWCRVSCAFALLCSMGAATAADTKVLYRVIKAA